MTGVEAWALAVAEILVPALLGWALGAAIRKWTRRPAGPGARIGLAIAPVAVAIAVYPPTVASLGLWDVVTLSLMLGLGLQHGAAWGVTLDSARRTVPTLLGTLATALILEVTCRVALPRPPESYPVRGVHLWTAAQRPATVHRFDPIHLPERLDPLRTPQLQEKTAPVVVHSGNSVVEGAGYCSQGCPFVEQLDAQDPSLLHVKAGVPGAGIDLGYLLFQRWIEAGRLDGFVLYLHPNLTVVTDIPYRACGGGPLLDYRPEGPRIACTDPSPSPSTPPPEAGALPATESLPASALESPVPFAIEVAASVSDLAGHLRWAISRATRPGQVSPHPAEVVLDHSREVLTAIGRRCQQEGIPWAVVMLPGRPELEGDQNERDRHRVIAHLARQTLAPFGVPVLDAFDHLLDATAREGAEALFADRCCHFNRRGNDLMVSWLREALAPTFEAVRRNRRPGGPPETRAGAPDGGMEGRNP